MQVHLLKCIYLKLLPATFFASHAVSLLVPPRVETLIVTQWDYLNPACGLVNTQAMKGTGRCMFLAEK